MRIYLYGSGGHAKVILDILVKQGQTLAGIADDDVSNSVSSIHGISLYSPNEVIRGNSPAEILWIVAIGNNRVRQLVANRLTSIGYQFATAVHPSAQISLGVNISPGAVVMANAVINTDARIGHHVIVNTGATIDHDCNIEDYSHIAPGCSLCGQVSIGVGTLLGVGTVVKPKLKVGDWTICGAGSTVVESLPPNVIAYGCPARIHS